MLKPPRLTERKAYYVEKKSVKLIKFMYFVGKYTKLWSAGKALYEVLLAFRRGKRMRKSGFTETQIVGMIKEEEAEASTAEVFRKHGLSQGTFHKVKSKYGGLEVLDAAKLKLMEDENAKLKRLLTDNIVMKVLLGMSLRHRPSGVRQRFLQFGIMISCSAGPVLLMVMILKPSDATARRTILRSEKR